MTDSSPFCIGHRGAKGHVAENTLASFSKAISLGCNWVELDVYLLEGELIVIHDKHVDRTTNGTGELKDLSMDYVRSLDAGHGEQVPTLEEVIDLVDHQCRINIELKGAGTAAATSKMLNAYCQKGWNNHDFLISSFDHGELALADENFPRGVLFGKLLHDRWQRAERLGAWSVNFNERHVTRELVIEAHEYGYMILTYTVNNTKRIAKLLDLGVDGIFSDYPDRVLALL